MGWNRCHAAISTHLRRLGESWMHHARAVHDRALVAGLKVRHNPTRSRHMLDLVGLQALVSVALAAPLCLGVGDHHTQAVAIMMP